MLPARRCSLSLLLVVVLALTGAMDVNVASAAVAKQVEDLDRGLISVRSGSGNLVSLAAARHRGPSTRRSTSTAAAPG